MAEPAITSDRLAEVWPAVSERLMRLLDKRGLTPTQAEDVCQDVAVRVLASEVTFETAEDLYRWAAHVARNLHVDLLRAASRVHCDDEVLHAIQAETDVEHEVERRIALSKVLRHWLSLRPSDQNALLEGMYSDGEGDRSDAVRRAVRRHRARQRLRLLAKGAFGWVAVSRALPGLRRMPRAVQTASVAAIAPLVLLAVSPAEHGAPAGPERRTTTSSWTPRGAVPPQDHDGRDDLAARSRRQVRPAAIAGTVTDGPGRHWHGRDFNGYDRVARVDTPAGRHEIASVEEEPGAQPKLVCSSLTGGCIDDPLVIRHHHG